MEDTSLDSIILSCNKLAMDHLREENFPAALHLLKRAQDLLEYPQDFPSKSKLLSVTLNNLGCYYKKLGKLTLSLQYLTRALHLELITPNDRINLAGTHLNITAIKSSMRQHEAALRHATDAINLLLEAEALDSNPSIKRTLAIAYHNAGIEHEFLGDLQKAGKLFQFGLALAEKYLGEHPVTDALRGSVRKMGMTTPAKKYSFENKTGYFWGGEFKSDRSLSNRQDSNRSISSIHSNMSGGFPDIHSRQMKPRVNRSVDRPPKKKKRGKRTVQPKELPKLPVRTIFHQRHSSANTYKSLEDKLSNLSFQLDELESEHLTRKPSIKPLSSSSRSSFHEKKKTSFLIRAIKSLLCKKTCQDKRKTLKVFSPQKHVPPSFPKSPKVVRIPRPPSRFIYQDLEPIPEAKIESNEGKILMIQAHFRRVLQERRYKKMKSAAVVIQKNIRMFQIRGLYQCIYSAIQFIQFFWRRYRRRRG